MEEGGIDASRALGCTDAARVRIVTVQQVVASSCSSRPLPRNTAVHTAQVVITFGRWETGESGRYYKLLRRVCSEEPEGRLAHLREGCLRARLQRDLRPHMPGATDQEGRH